MNDLEEAQKRIDSLTVEEMATLWESAPRGAWPFHSWVLGDYFMASFRAKTTT